jgi:hypothetical protein
MTFARAGRCDAMERNMLRKNEILPIERAGAAADTAA